MTHWHNEPQELIQISSHSCLLGKSYSTRILLTLTQIKMRDNPGHWRDRTADLGVISTTL